MESWNEDHQSEPSTVTYATYRGSRQIRKLKKKLRAQVESAIPEGGEDTVTLPAYKENMHESGNQYAQNGFHTSPQVILDLSVNGHLPKDNSGEVSQSGKSPTFTERLESSANNIVSHEELVVSQNIPPSPVKKELFTHVEESDADHSRHEDNMPVSMPVQSTVGLSQKRTDKSIPSSSRNDIKSISDFHAGSKDLFSFLSDQNVNPNVGEMCNGKENESEKNGRGSPSLETNAVSPISKPHCREIKEEQDEPSETGRLVEHVTLMKDYDICNSETSAQMITGCSSFDQGENHGEEVNMSGIKAISTAILQQTGVLKDEGKELVNDEKSVQLVRDNQISNTSSTNKTELLKSAAKAFHEIQPEDVNSAPAATQDSNNTNNYQDTIHSCIVNAHSEKGKETSVQSKENVYSSRLDYQNNIPMGSTVQARQNSNTMTDSGFGKEDSQNTIFSKTRGSSIYESLVQHRKSFKVERETSFSNKYDSPKMPIKHDNNMPVLHNHQTNSGEADNRTKHEAKPIILDSTAQSSHVSPNEAADKDLHPKKINEVEQNSIYHRLEPATANVADVPLSSTVDEIVDTLLNLAIKRVKTERDGLEVSNAKTGWPQRLKPDANNGFRSAAEEAVDGTIHLEKGEGSNPDLVHNLALQSSDKVLIDISLLSKAKEIVEEMIDLAIERVTNVQSHGSVRGTEADGAFRKQLAAMEDQQDVLRAATKILTGETVYPGLTASSSESSKSLFNTLVQNISSPLPVSCPAPNNSKEETPSVQTDYQSKEDKPWSVFVTDQDTDNDIIVTAVKVVVDPEMEEQELMRPDDMEQIIGAFIESKEEENSALHGINIFQRFSGQQVTLQGNRTIHGERTQLMQKDLWSHTSESESCNLNNDLNEEMPPVHVDCVVKEGKQWAGLLTDQGTDNDIVVTAVKVNIDPETEDDDTVTPPDFALQPEEQGDFQPSFIVLSKGSLEDQTEDSSEDETDSLPSFPLQLSPDNSDPPANGSIITHTEYDFEYQHGMHGTTECYLNDYNPELLLNPDSRQHKMYPLSLSPIPEGFFEDDSSTEDDPSDIFTVKKLTKDVQKQSLNKPLSVLELLQSVSEHLQQSNVSIENDNHSKEKPMQELSVSPNDTSQHPGTRHDQLSSISLDDNQAATLSQILPSPYILTPKEPLVDQNNSTKLLDAWQDQISILSAENKEIKTPTKVLPPSHLMLSNDLSVQDLSVSQTDSSQHSNIQSEQAPPDTSPRMPLKSTLQPKSASTDSVFYRYLQAASNHSKSNEAKVEHAFGYVSLPTVLENELDQLAQSRGASEYHNDAKDAKINPRPGKMVIYDGLHNGGSKEEIWSDVTDASSWQFPSGASVEVIRGCWILYEKPNYQGQMYMLEEGETALKQLWTSDSTESSSGTIVIGSIKQAVKNHSIPEIELFQETSNEGSIIYLQNKIANVEVIQPTPSSITVNSGTWLAYKKVDFQGQYSILEQGHSASVNSTGVKSLRPMKMGGLKVQMPLDPKIIIYEKPHFEGQVIEVSENVNSITALLDDGHDHGENLEGVGSIRVTGGVWVAYENEGYRGHQYLLEEGEYEDWQAWGGFNSALLSLRYLQGDFLDSSVMLVAKFPMENGKTFEISNQEIPSLPNAGIGSTMRAIYVNSGVWVAYDQEYFCGEQYVLEKGTYKSFLEWGGANDTIMSIRPIQLETFGIKEPPYMLKAYSMPDFKGMSEVFHAKTAACTSFSPNSFKVLRGCWLLYDEEEFTGNQFVLEDGRYTDFNSFGCLSTTIKSLKPIKYYFSEPSVEIFALDSCEGRTLHFETAVNSILSEEHHFHTQSLRVNSGLWIAYEGENFNGRQMLLEPSEISDWTQHSGWHTIGSLHPVSQPKVYFRIKNRNQGTFLTACGDLSEKKATKVVVCPHNGSNSQIWYYSYGLLKSKANRTCLDIIGGQDVPGSKVAICIENGKPRQKWKINQNGTISSYLNDQLVLDIKGGDKFDKDHVIIKQPMDEWDTPLWDIEAL